MDTGAEHGHAAVSSSLSVSGDGSGNWRGDEVEIGEGMEEENLGAQRLPP